MPIAPMSDRAVLDIAGEDRVAFLQGLVSNDVALAAPGQAVWAALLTPQGKWLADFFLFAHADRLLLDCEAVHAPMLLHKLARFRLRSQVALRDATAEYGVLAGWDAAPPPDAIAAPDPRLAKAGWRALVPAGTPPDPAAAAAWDLHRLALGLPDGSRDLVSEASILLEAGFDELHGIAWTKGCYLGQELTARTKYRGLLKRRLLPVGVAGPLPDRGTPILAEDGREVGDMRSGRDDRGLALLRLDAIALPALRCGDAVLTPRVPAWMHLPT